MAGTALTAKHGPSPNAAALAAGAGLEDLRAELVAMEEPQQLIQGEGM